MCFCRERILRRSNLPLNITLIEIKALLQCCDSLDFMQGTQVSWRAAEALEEKPAGRSEKAICGVGRQQHHNVMMLVPSWNAVNEAKAASPKSVEILIG